ncbi:MAG: homoserine dehydrogenase [Anaerolinea sp.]|nr:homoserine dehydrogenase [Anaerolinea sp.]
MSVKRLVFMGFGNVGQALARLLLQKRDLVQRDYDTDFIVTGIYTRRHGAAINPDGLDIHKVLNKLKQGGSLDSLSIAECPTDSIAFIHTYPGDVLFENSPVNHHTGQPAIDHLKTALELGMDAITANKGPVVHGYQMLTKLASKMGKRFLFESTVMDGAPIFSLFRAALPGIELRGFKGILNSCTNMLLTEMENGRTFEQALEYGRQIGITETDPSADVDGWDAAIKVAALSTVLMGIPLLPQDVQREGIRGITPFDLESARSQGKRWKLVCSARRNGNDVEARVAPEMVGPDSPLYSINGTSSYAQFETDTLPGLGIVESDPGPETTAYGLFADWLQTLKQGG